MVDLHENRPNVLLLLTDQERYDATSPDGADVTTPNLDRLAAEGMRFDRAYTPISICTSARASLLTGQYPHNHGMLNNCHEEDGVLAELPPELPTFGELLAESGYENSYFGKWHVGRTATPDDFGFRYLGGDDGHHDSEDEEFRAHQREHGVDPDAIHLTDAVYAEYGDDRLLVSAEQTIPKEATWTHYVADRTIERIRECESLDEPFFHRTDFEGPHHPYVVPEPYASMYDPEDVELWANYLDSLEDKPSAHGKFLEYRGVADFDRETWAEAISKYFGFVTFLDDEIGRILEALDETGLTDETLVIRAADHGDMTGSHRQFNKGPMMYEETYHIPMVMRWPGVIEGGRSSEEFVRLLDLMPTLLDLAGIDVPSAVDGRSLVSLIQGEVPDTWPDSVFTEYHGEEFGLYSQRMVRTDRYKFVYNGPDRNEFYDLRRDPDELENLIDHPGYEDERAAMVSRLTEWMERTDDSIRRWPPKVLE